MNSGKYLVPIHYKTRPSNKLLVCFPHAGGGASTYFDFAKLATAANSNFDICAVQLPGHENRFNEEAHSNIHRHTKCIADEIKSTVATDIALYGHSLGSVLAYEVAIQIAHGEKKIYALIVSGRNGPTKKTQKEKISHLSDSDFTNALNSYGGVPKEIIENREIMELLLPTLKKDFYAAENYISAKENPRLSCPVLGLPSQEDDFIDPELFRGWREVTNGEFIVKWFPGNHFYVVKNKERLFESINQFLLSVNS